MFLNAQDFSGYFSARCSDFIWPVQIQQVLLYHSKSNGKLLLHNIVLWIVIVHLKNIEMETFSYFLLMKTNVPSNHTR